MLWKIYGELVVEYLLDGARDYPIVQEIAKMVDKKLILGIDAHDAEATYKFTAHTKGGKINAYSLPMVISAFNCQDIRDNEKQQSCFLAANLMKNLIEACVYKCEKEYNARVDIQFAEKYKGNVLVLGKNIPWREIVDSEYPEIDFVISPSNHPGAPYSLVAVQKELGDRQVKRPIKRRNAPWFKGFIHAGEWIAGGASIEELKRLADCNTFIFVSKEEEDGYSYGMLISRSELDKLNQDK